MTPPAHAAAFRPEDPVAYIGQESLFFAQFVVGAERCDRALDLGAGAGLLSVLAPGREVVAVELDPFAAEVARFNVSMGGHDHVGVVEGDLFGPVAGERFDLVIANPPFLPAPAGVMLPLCGNGGPTGDRMLQRVLAGVEEHLTARSGADLRRGPRVGGRARDRHLDSRGRGVTRSRRHGLRHELSLQRPDIGSADGPLASLRRQREGLLERLA